MQIDVEKFYDQYSYCKWPTWCSLNKFVDRGQFCITSTYHIFWQWSALKLLIHYWLSNYYAYSSRLHVLHILISSEYWGLCLISSLTNYISNKNQTFGYSDQNAWQILIAYDACIRLCLNAWARGCAEAPEFLKDECLLLRNAFGYVCIPSIPHSTYYVTRIKKIHVTCCV